MGGAGRVAALALPAILSLGLPLLFALGFVLSSWSFHLGEVRVGGVALRGGTPPALNRSAPEIDVHFSGWSGRGMAVLVDREPIPVQVLWLHGRATATPPVLRDGLHSLTVRAAGDERTWRFRVDTAPPAARLESPRPGTLLSKATVALRARAEPGSLLEIEGSGGRVSARADSFGRLSLDLPLRHGSNDFRWAVRDEAGNRTGGRLVLNCDLTPPQVTLLSPARDGVTDTNSPVLRLAVSDPESGIRAVRLGLDGGALASLPLPRTQSTAPLEHRLRSLFEGRRTVVVEAENGLGVVRRETLHFVVDSTEEFGRGVLTEGARGRDVADLQDRLRREGFAPGADLSGSFGSGTRTALVAFQEKAGLKPDGIAGPYALGALGARIFVNLARFSLVLEEPDGSTRTYPIATGTEEFPTPTGRFHVTDLARNPTWVPPDSVWAKEAKVTPPGPGNPLGTRWIGLNAGVVGIHGTPAEWTIGSRASHGCMRMTVADVEDLFERVGPGTRVAIFEGSEKDPDVLRLWPERDRPGRS